MSFTLRTVAELGLDLTASVLERGFSDYVIRISFTPALLFQLIRQDSVDTVASAVVMEGDTPLGVGLIARRGWTSRLAGMAVVPEARRRGVGAFLVRELLAASRARGERSMILEVIESNEGAVRLYRSFGFQVKHRLLGFKYQPISASAPDIDRAGAAGVNASAPPSESPLEPADIRRVARLVSMLAPDLPWQISGESLAQSGPPSQAYRLGDAFVVVSDPSQPAIVLRAIVTRPEAQRRGHALALLETLARTFPDRPLIVPPICPEPMAPLFERAGWARTPLSQLLMQLDT